MWFKLVYHGIEVGLKMTMGKLDTWSTLKVNAGIEISLYISYRVVEYICS